MSQTPNPEPMVTKDMRRVGFATIIGTTVEWYDFFLYATAAGLIFDQLFFAPLGSELATLVSFATVGISFLFRPLGAFLGGHLGDRIGRKKLLVWTLVLMGGATTLMGALPTYAQIGIAAPIILVFLRIMQGLSTGGEWGAAVLMAVEHSPKGKRGRFGAFPQMGVPLGLLLASGMIALMRILAPGDAFYQWGWRVPFLLSFILILIGYFVRLKVEESPVFIEMSKMSVKAKVPIVELFRKHWLLVILAALTFAGNNAAGYMTTGGFLQKYATQPIADGGALGMDLATVQFAVTLSAIPWLLFTYFGGWVSDKIGRRNTYIAGWITFLVTVWFLFPLVNTGVPVLFFLGIGIFTIGNGLTYGPQAAYFSELFPASIRYTGVSVTYAIGAIAGGAFAPLISAWLIQKTGDSTSVAWYLAGMMTLAFIATLLLKDRSDIPLGADAEEEQARTPIYGFSEV